MSMGVGTVLMLLGRIAELASKLGQAALAKDIEEILSKYGAREDTVRSETEEARRRLGG
jgi:Na+-translocating ferredoxin:NAD+ oxidoreductase RnfE subunit